jgi:hypothetical protein
MFPVLVTLDNREGLLKPGMNGEVTVLVERREDVLSVPNDAVRQTREAAATAKLVGLNVDSVVAAVQEQMRAMGGGMNGGGGAPNGNGGGRGGSGLVSRGDVVVSPVALQGGGQGGRQGFQMPEVTDAQCKQVTDAFAKAPTAQTTLQGLRGRVQAGEIDQQRSRAMSDSIYKSLGLDSQVARACQFRGRQGGTEGRGGRGGSTPNAANAPTAAAGAGENAGSTGRRGGRRGNSSAALMAGMDVPVNQASPRRQMARPALVYVVSGTSFAPRVVRVGMSDLDYTEVVSGLQEGEQVLLLTALQMQASRDSALARMRRGAGGGMPGMPGGGAPGGGGPGRGGRG